MTAHQKPDKDLMVWKSLMFDLPKEEQDKVHDMIRELSARQEADPITFSMAVTFLLLSKPVQVPT